MTTRTFTTVINKLDLDSFAERVESANKKLAKMQTVSPISFEISTENTFEVGTREFVEMNRDRDNVKLILTYPSIDNISGVDCEYVGYADTEDDTNIQYKMLNGDNVEEFKNIKSLGLNCFHCGKKISRNAYYYFKKSDGEYIALGKNCATSYFPFDPMKFTTIIKKVFVDIEQLISLGLIDNLGGHGDSKYMYLNDVFVFGAMATNGFTSWVKDKTPVFHDYGRKSFTTYEQNPESTLLAISNYSSYFANPTRENERTRNKGNEILSKIEVTFDYMKSLFDKYFKNKDENWDSFTENMHNALYTTNDNGEFILRTYIHKKTLGTVAYAFKKAYDMDAKEKAIALKNSMISEMANTDEFYGNVGDSFKKNNVHVTLISTRSFEGAYGFTWLYTMKDSVGHTFVWFASNPITNYLMEEEVRNAIAHNEIIEFDIVGGSIKNHKTYTDKNGVETKQTIITRCSLANFKKVA